VAAAPSVDLAIKSKIIRLPDGGRDTSTTILRVVGGDVMYLQGVYHPDQLWLNGLGPIIHHVEDQPVKVGPMPSDETARRLKNRLESKWASLEPEARHLYIPEKGVEQIVLPFPDRRAITVKVWERLARANWPCFDKDPTTRQPYRVTWIREETMGNAEKELMDHLVERCTARYYVKRHGSRNTPAKFVIHFENYRDFVEIKLLA
jgi:hypothetical protein